MTEGRGTPIMSDTDSTSPLRNSKLLDGLMNPAEFGADMGWGPRTILRREAEGMPVIIIGKTKWYPIAKVREWIMLHLREHAPPRRGRPRKT